MFKINYKSDTIELNDVEFSCKKCACMFLMWCDESKLKFYEQQVREDKELEEFREKLKQRVKREEEEFEEEIKKIRQEVVDKLNEEEQQEEEQQEEPQQEQEEEPQQEQEEEQEEETEEQAKEIITLDDIKIKFNEKYSKNSADAYMRGINRIFIDNNYLEVLKDANNTINKIIDSDLTVSKKKNDLCALGAFIGLYAPNEDIQKKISEITKNINGSLIVKKSKENEELKDIKIAYEMMEKLKKTYDEKPDAYLHLVLKYGVLRPDELNTIEVMFNDNLKLNLDERNYIDLSKKKLIINKHKTFKTYGQKVIDLDDDFIKLVDDKVGGYLFGKNGKGEYPYAKGDGLNVWLRKKYNCDVYELRKMKTSIILKEEDENERIKLEKFQGHDAGTMCMYYKQYV